MIKLFNYLNEADVEYCQWKSTYRLNDSFKGLTDFDILVSPSSIGEMYSILLKLNYHQMVRHDNSIAGILDFIGYDIDEEVNVHIHLHSRLIVGGKSFKSHLLPFRGHLLRQAAFGEYSIPVVSLEHELSLLLVRIMLKLGVKDVVKSILLKRLIPEDLFFDLRSLRKRVNKKGIALDSLNLLEPVISGKQLKAIFDILSNKQPNIFKIFKVKRDLLRQMEPWLMKSKISYFSALFMSELTSLIPWRSKRKKKTLLNGGFSVAFVGADGSGKSTIVKCIERWLSWKLDTRVVYGGFKPRKLYLRLYLKIASLLNLMPIDFFRVTLKNVVISEYYLALHKHLGKQRNQGYKFYSQGSVVLYDRFPLKELDGIMDWRLPPCESADFLKKYRGKCLSMLKSTPLPDLIIVLNVDIETAYRRKSDHDRIVLQRKIDGLTSASIAGTCVKELSSHAPINITLPLVKKIIWEHLW